MHYLIVYKSVTFVNRMKKMINDKYPVSVVQLPGNLGIKGCHYALRCNANDLDSLIGLSERNKIAIQAVFSESDDKGAARYVKYDIS